MLEEIFLPTHLRLRRDFNYSYTDLLIIHKAGHLSAPSPLNQNKVSDIPQACACCAWVLRTLPVYTSAEVSHHFLQGLLWLNRNLFFSHQINSKCEREPFWRKVIIFDFRSNIIKGKWCTRKAQIPFDWFTYDLLLWFLKVSSFKIYLNS